MRTLLAHCIFTSLAWASSIHFMPGSASASNSKASSFGIAYQDTVIEGIDLHMHPGSYESLGPLGKAFILARLPEFLPDFLKDLSLRAAASLLQNPYGAFIGIKSQCIESGMSRCGLFTTYAPQSWGVVSNQEVQKWLEDDRNFNPNTGQPVFFGLASLDMQNWQENKTKNLAELETALENPAFAGIKLAFIHNNIPLDDPQYDGIYEVAARTGKPVYHHVGSTPIRKLSDFPTQEERDQYIRSYDPAGLERVIQNYPTVSFILGHMGFDFNKEGFAFDENVFELAAKYPNVYIEISAFGGPIYDPDGHYKDKTFQRLKEAKLLDRTLYGSDGPGTPGGAKRYRDGVLASMNRVGYSAQEAQAVFSTTTKKLFKLD